jgi:hypothetical protein
VQAAERLSKEDIIEFAKQLCVRADELSSQIDAMVGESSLQIERLAGKAEAPAEEAAPAAEAEPMPEPEPEPEPQRQQPEVESAPEIEEVKAARGADTPIADFSKSKARNPQFKLNPSAVQQTSVFSLMQKPAKPQQPVRVAAEQKPAR